MRRTSITQAGLAYDPWFSRRTAGARLIFYTLLNHPTLDSLGTRVATLQELSDETNLPLSLIGSSIIDLAEPLHYDTLADEIDGHPPGPRVYYWPDHDLFWIFYRYPECRERSNPEKYDSAARKALEKLPDDVQAVIKAHYPQLAEAHAEA